MTGTDQNKANNAANSAASITNQADLLQILCVAMRLPTKELAASLSDGSFGAELGDIVANACPSSNCEPVNAAMQQLKTAENPKLAQLQTLRHAYTTLFTHPKKPLIAPYENLFLFWQKTPDAPYKEAPPLFISDSALSAERIYKAAGLSRNTAINESADHIATELEFLSQLYAHKAALLTAGNSEALMPVDAVIAEFATYHVSKWWQKFFAKLSAASPHPFYSGIGLLGKACTAQIEQRYLSRKQEI